jgi:Fibronectin type III domain
VRNVKNITVDLKWDPPEFFNGVLNDYEVHVNGTPFKVSKNEENQTAKVNYTVVNLQPFAKYDIAVRACTNKCSESVKLEVITQVGAPGNFTEQPRIENKGSKIFNSSYTSAIISWNEPTYKGGNLDYYELKTVFYSNDGSSAVPKIVKIKSNKCLMEKLCVNNVTGQYDFSVRGVNFVSTPHATQKNFPIRGSHEIANCETGDIELLKSLNELKINDPHGWHIHGEWSPAFGNSCHYSNFNTKQYVLIIFLMIASLVFVVMVFYLYRKIKDMKDILVQMPPGLEDLTGDKTKKGKDHSLSKIERPDILHNTLDNTSINNEDEHGRLLRRSMNGSLNGADCSSSMHSDSTRSEMDHMDMTDEIGYIGLNGKQNSMTENDKMNVR